MANNGVEGDHVRLLEVPDLPSSILPHAVIEGHNIHPGHPACHTLCNSDPAEHGGIPPLNPPSLSGPHRTGSNVAGQEEKCIRWFGDNMLPLCNNLLFERSFSPPLSVPPPRASINPSHLAQPTTTLNKYSEHSGISFISSSAPRYSRKHNINGSQQPGSHSTVMQTADASQIYTPPSSFRLETVPCAMATVSSCEIAEIGMAQGQNTTMSQRWFDLNWKQFKAVVYHSQLNSFLVFIPVSWLLHFTSQADGTNAQDANIFIFSLLSIISLTKLLNFAVSELSIRVGRRLASLLNAISHNIVGLTVATISLINCDVEVVQSTFTGLMLSHLLLVLGMSFVVGGMRCSRNEGSIQLNMLLSSTFAGLAFFFRILYFIASTVIGVDVSEVGQAILALSRWIAFALLIIYMILLSLRGVSLRSIYQRAEKYISAVGRSQTHSDQNCPGLPQHTEGIHTSNGSATSSSPTHCGREYEHDDDDFSAGMAKDDAEAEAGRCTRNRLTSEKKAHTLSLLVALLFVALFIGLLVRTTQFLMESIDGVTKTTKFSRRFISLILLPIVGRFAEITDCCKAGMDVAEDSDRSRTDDAFESCAQIGWFITPLVIILGRMTGKPLTLLFDTLEVVVLLLSVSIVAHVMTQNNSRLLKGTILLGLYATVAMLFFYYPGSTSSQSCC